jgi:hypothetical protein
MRVWIRVAECNSLIVVECAQRRDVARLDAVGGEGRSLRRFTHLGVASRTGWRISEPEYVLRRGVLHDFLKSTMVFAHELH